MSIWKGLTAFVTGGAGALGSSVVRDVVRKGGKAVIFDLPETQSSVNILLDKINSKNAIFIPGDVTSENDVTSAITKVTEEFGRIHTCVSCAGINNAYQIVNTTTHVPNKIEDVISVINTNLIGTFNVTRLVSEHMAQSPPNENGERGTIINTSGFYDKDGWKGQSTVSAASNAVSGMTLPIARDLSSVGIRVCTISPGIFESHYVEDWPDEVHMFLKGLTLHPQRYGKPKEFAHLVENIVKNPMLNGSVLKLDGGLRMSVL